MLSRCGVLEPGPMNYVKLLERFQDRSDQGKFYDPLLVRSAADAIYRAYSIIKQKAFEGDISRESICMIFQL